MPRQHFKTTTDSSSSVPDASHLAVMGTNE